ncbi:hypothetical protein CP532_1912 [Ophiocordyceps camponoti-leonardi (nom. inval.)]|nr:hypothetical protein CP532_1912 [Ophiocordyceps camponoti-leonardi (nom. inval.)]
MWNLDPYLVLLMGHVATVRGVPFELANAVQSVHSSFHIPRVKYPSEPPMTVTILADSNRDGVVDTEGDSDFTGKRIWTADSGALFLANIVDTDRRCSMKITESTPDEELGSCHDASDNILRNPSFLAPLRTLPVLTPALKNKDKGSITVFGKVAQANTRIFQKKGSEWIYINSSHSFSASELRAGLQLGIDARDVRRPGRWDGRAEIHFTVRNANRIKAVDWVQLRVAPVLIHHHLQKAEQLIVQSAFIMEKNVNQTDLQFNAVQSRFVRELDEIARAAGLPLLQLNDSSYTDIWVQDFFEPGYMTIPGPDGPVGLRVMIRSAQESRPSGRQVFQTMRSGNVGAVQHLAWGGTSDSMGNLEAIPPYTHSGKTYPAGRAIMGSQYGEKPYMMNFLKAQELQDPIEIDTSWLFIGHADEFMQFLPYNSSRGWVLVVSDPLAGLQVLADAMIAGHGEVKSHSRPLFPSDREECFSAGTIEDSLLLPYIDFVQDYCAQAIEKNVDIIKRETGITDEEIIRIPAIFYFNGFTNSTTIFSHHCHGTIARDDDWTEDEGNHDSQGKLFRKSTLTTKPKLGDQNERASGMRGVDHSKQRDKSELVTAWQEWLKADEDERETARTWEKVKSSFPVSTLYPGSINSIVISDSAIIAPDPWGPLVAGIDILAEAVEKAYAKANYSVIFVDDWFSHFSGGGDIHCGTNTMRDMTASWY